MTVVHRAFAHTAAIDLYDGDPVAVAAAVSALVCGNADHDGPCPIAPHHITIHTDPTTSRVRLRILFIVEPHHEPHLRHLIGTALAAGRYPTPDQPPVTHWQLHTHRPSPPRPTDYRLASRLHAHGHTTEIHSRPPPRQPARPDIKNPPT